MYGLAHLKAIIARRNHADIALLTAHGRIEGRLIRDQRALIALSERLGKRSCVLAALLRKDAHHRGDFALVLQLVIAGELACERRIDLLIRGLRLAHIVRRFSCLPSGLALYLHRLLETCLIDRETALGENFPRQIEREAVGVVKFKRILAGKLGLLLRGERLLKFREDRKTLVNRAVKLCLFLGQNL